MFKTTLRSLFARWRRILTTSFAIVIGVAFLAGTLVLTDTVGKTFDDLFADVNAGTDALVRSTAVIEGDFASVRKRIPEGLVGVVERVDGVRVAEGEVGNYAQITDADGDTIGNPAAGPPTFGANWVVDEGLSPLHLFEGRAPTRRGEVVIDRASAKIGDLSVGDRTTIVTTSAPERATVVGIAKFGKADSPGGATFALFDLATAQRLLGRPGQLDGIRVAGAEGTSQKDLVRRISRVLPDGVEVITGDALTEENQDDIGRGLRFFNTFMVTFALIALFVSSFIIYNTFSILVAQRTRELALLRAVGAGRGQVLGSVLAEALLVGAVASALGVVAGIAVAGGLKALLAGLGIDLPAAGLVVKPGSVGVAAAVGVAVTTVSSALPARRAAKIPPVAAIRDLAVENGRASRRRVITGLVITALSIGALLGGLVRGGNGGLSLVGLGAQATFIGVAVLGPAIARPVSRLLGTPLRRLRGITGALAQENALRNPKRTSATAMALTVGVGLIAFITIFAASAKHSLNAAIDRTFIGDFVIDSRLQGFGGLSPTLAERLSKLPAVDATSGLRFAAVRHDGDNDFVFGLDPAALSQILDLGITAGSLDDLGAGTIALQADTAEDLDLAVGDTVTLQFAETGSRKLSVAAIYENGDLIRKWFLPLATFERNVADQLDAQVYVKVASDVPLADARVAIEKVTAGYPNAEVDDLTEFKANQAQMVNQILGLIYVLLLLAVVVAVMGIATTLGLSILERTHELGLLRAVGMTRPQLRSSVRWEAVLISLLGATVGLAIGLLFGWAMVQALADEGIDRLSVPIGQLAVIAAIAGGVGVIAGWAPARRAARLDVLDAIATE